MFWKTQTKAKQYIAKTLLSDLMHDEATYTVFDGFELTARGGVILGNTHTHVRREINVMLGGIHFTSEQDHLLLKATRGNDEYLFFYKFFPGQGNVWMQLIEKV